MKHVRSSAIRTCKGFLLDNVEFLIFGGTIAVGMLFGVLFAGQVPFVLSSFVFQQPEPVITCFFRSLGCMTLYLFLLFFCGTSAMGFLSPFVLVHFGLCVGTGVGTAWVNGMNYSFYMLCVIPFYLMAAVVLLRVEINSFPLSFRFLRLGNGHRGADLPGEMRTFILRCLLSLVFSAVLCFLFSLYQKGIGSLLVA